MRSERFSPPNWKPAEVELFGYLAARRSVGGNITVNNVFRYSEASQQRATDTVFQFPPVPSAAASLRWDCLIHLPVDCRGTFILTCVFWAVCSPFRSSQKSFKKGEEKKGESDVNSSSSPKPAGKGETGRRPGRLCPAAACLKHLSSATMSTRPLPLSVFLCLS